MTRTLNWTAAIAFASLSTVPALAAGPSPVGQWEISTGEARYQIVSCGEGELCAKLVWLRDDARTPQNLALLNSYVVRGAEPNGQGTWSGNVTFNGHDYRGTMTLLNHDLMSLKGCSGLLCQTVQLQRI